VNLKDRIIVELMLLAPHHEQLTLAVLTEEYPFFFGLNDDSDAIESALRELVAEDMVAVHDDCWSLAPANQKRARTVLREFDLTDGAAISVRSRVDRAYSDRLRDEHGIMGITEPIQQEYLAEELSRLAGPVLDAGCGRGSLTSLLRHRTGHEFIGIDISPDSIGVARAEDADISFEVRDFNDLQSIPSAFGSVLFVDTLYFTCTPEKVLDAAAGRITDGGGIVALYSVYARPGDEVPAVSPEMSPVRQFADEHDYRCDTSDFAAQEATTWRIKHDLIRSLRQDYLDERVAYLYYRRLSEISLLVDMTGRGASARYGFVIRPS
jgi:SAM-dependent methyltransferase